jgi:hypothetical protein
MLKKDGIASESGHYNIGEVQPIDLIASQNLDFFQGSIIKYVCRFRHKGTPIKDLQKAMQYLEWLIQLTKEETPK